MADTQQDHRLTEGEIEQVAADLKITNDQRKVDRLRRKANRAHEWRTQVHAQSEITIRSCNKQIEDLGGDPYEPYSPQFDDEAMLDHYATMSLPK